MLCALTGNTCPLRELESIVFRFFNHQALLAGEKKSCASFKRLQEKGENKMQEYKLRNGGATGIAS